jgi:hypothetical protein
LIMERSRGLVPGTKEQPGRSLAGDDQLRLREPVRNGELGREPAGLKTVSDEELAARKQNLRDLE